MEGRLSFFSNVVGGLMVLELVLFFEVNVIWQSVHWGKR